MTGCPETSLRNYATLRVITQESAVIIFFAAETWHHADNLVSFPAIKFRISQKHIYIYIYIYIYTDQHGGSCCQNHNCLFAHSVVSSPSACVCVRVCFFPPECKRRLQFLLNALCVLRREWPLRVFCYVLNISARSGALLPYAADQCYETEITLPEKFMIGRGNECDRLEAWDTK